MTSVLCRSSSHLRLAWLAALAAAIVLGLGCLAAALTAPHINLVHVAYYNSCAIRTYAYHWQNPERQPEVLRYDFVNSPDSLIVIALWLDKGPSWNLSQALPINCPA